MQARALRSTLLLATIVCLATAAPCGAAARRGNVVHAAVPDSQPAPHAASVAAGAPEIAAEPATGNPLDDVARAFEASRALGRAERMAELERIDGSLNMVMRGLEGDRRSAAQFLSGAVSFERGDFGAAGDRFRHAADASGHFEDDAAFATIRSLEGSGHDAEAAREWAKWEKRYPTSPLLAEARLASAWNALRRGEAAQADSILATLVRTSPWTAASARVSIARATTRMQQGRPADALALLGPRPDGAAATYLVGVCQQALGARLLAAAAFQDVADRYPDSPLRDAALLAKADAFLDARDYRSAAQEFSRAAARMSDASPLRAEAELRSAGSVFLAGKTDSALTLLQALVSSNPGSDVAARAQFLVGEALVAAGRPADAILAYNQVLTQYFQHKVAASAQYRVARCLDTMGRRSDATGSYEAVVRGYPLEPEAPAAAYRAGVGMLIQQRPLAAAPYFQLVMDRYATQRDAKGLVVFASPEHQELVEAALCLLELSYHRAGNLGQLSGAPHVLLQKMPPSASPWRAYALLIDADASASQARYPEAQASLEGLMRDFPNNPVGASATKLLAWTYARQGRDSLAIATEERLLARYGTTDPEISSVAMLDIAHERFNQRRFADAAAAYEEFLHRFPTHSRRMLARYQAGLCYLRLNRAGDAVDRWEAIVRDSASSVIAERAWARAGDVYFQAERYVDAKRCYNGLLEHFAGSPAAALATLRLAQCEYNAGHDAEALAMFSRTTEQYPGTPPALEAKHGTELALYRLSQTPAGAQQLARLIEQFPGSAFAADAQFKLAQRDYAQSHWTDAAEGFRRVVSQFPSFSAADQAQYLMAEALVRAKQPADARLAYEQFLSFFPASELRPTVRFRLGLMDFEAKDYAPAAVAFTQVLGESTTTETASAARYNLALCQSMLGQTDDARATLEAYRSQFPGDARAADVACQLGSLNESAGRIEDAAAEYERGLAARPSARAATELAFRLGRCREQLGARDRALVAYQQAAAATDRDDPFRLSAVARCAALYEGKRDVARALAAYRDLIRNANDRELVAAANDRVAQLEAQGRHH